jgi:hypothetical protein
MPTRVPAGHPAHHRFAQAFGVAREGAGSNGLVPYAGLPKIRSLA